MPARFLLLKLWSRHFWWLALGVLLATLTLLASVGLLTLSGWFLAASAMAGSVGIYSFNYMLPAAGVRGAAILRTAARYLDRLVSHDATFRVLKHLRVTAFAALFPLSPARTQRFRQGDLLNRFVGDIETLDHLYLRVISPLIGALLVIIVVGVGLATISLQSGILIALNMLTVLLIFPPLFYRLGKSTGQQLAGLSSRYRQQLTCGLSSVAELKIYPQQQRWQDTLAATEQQWLKMQRYQRSLDALAQSLVIAFGGLTMITVLWLAISDSNPGAMGADTALLLFCTLAAFEALGPVATAFLHLSEVTIAAERLSDLLNQPPEVTFPATFPSLPVSGVGLSVKDLSFQYPGAVMPTLSGFNFKLAAGERIALLGVTGCGKSTFLQLLTRAWDPQQGEIIFAGHPLPAWSEAQLRESISVVTQRVAIFNQTLRQNLLLAAPAASDQQLCDALEQTGLQTLLEGQGLAGWLGEGGRTLSGGERHRLAIARALLHNGALWLLDEPLEGLDAATERQMITLLNDVTQHRSVIMVTHRLNGLEMMDRICIMESGKLTEQGTHQQLTAERGRYWQFLQYQALQGGR